MSALVLMGLLGVSMLLPIFVNSDSDEGDDTADPPEPGPVVDGTDGADMLTAIANEMINGAEGDDTLTATDASDGAVLNGGEGADRLSLNGQNGTANGGLGADSIEMFVPDGGDPETSDTSVINGGEGNDTLNAAGTDGIVNGDGGDDMIDVQGRLDGAFGGDGDDTIHGGALDSAGGTSLFGEAGNDVLSTSDDAGFDYRSELDGGAGNDTLTTELLNTSPTVLDAFTGGEGNDTFAASFTFAPEDLSIGAAFGTLFEVTDFDAEDDALVVEIVGSSVFINPIDAPNRVSFEITDLEDGSGSILDFTVQNADAAGPLTGSILLSGVTGIDADTVDFSIELAAPT